MAWYLWTILTFFAFGLAQAIYAIVQAIVGHFIGATVEVISVGFGPVLFEKKLNGVAWRISSIPWGAYTKFFTKEDESPDSIPKERRDEPKSFRDLPANSRVILMLAGPTATILLGLCCTAIPIFTASDQLVVDGSLPEVWKKNGVPHLTVSDRPSSWNGQFSLLRSTAVEFMIRILTFQSLAGWGGYCGWLSTLGFAGTHSIGAWLSCFGVTLIWMGAINLIPSPNLNGGHLVFLLLEPLLGKHYDRVLEVAAYIGIALSLLVMGRIILADCFWLATSN